MANIDGIAGVPLTPAAGGQPALEPPPPVFTWWDHVLDLGLTLWVVRVPFAGVLIGFLFLGLVPQAQDLFVERAMALPWQIFAFLALLTFVWAVPTHYTARLLVEADARYRERITVRKTCFMHLLKHWTPRVLGTATYAAMIGGVVRSLINLPVVGDAVDTIDQMYIDDVTFRLKVLIVLLVVVGIVFFIVTVFRKRIAATRIMHAAESIAARVLGVLATIVPRWLYARGPTNAARIVTSDLGPLVLLVLSFFFTILPMAFPLYFAELFPRAASLTFIIGGWIPILGYLSGMGREWRVPLITIIFAVINLLPLALGDNYAVRRIEAGKTLEKLIPGTKPDTSSDLTTRIKLNDAVDWWKHANGQDCVNDTKRCPRPIIVAAAGGASRAGFFTASVIGQLLDDKLKIDGNGGHGLTPRDTAKRLFAISSVSGSSVGAVMTVAALASSTNGEQPCKAKTYDLWRGFYRNEQIDTWRSCLEALMAGDFLTPVFTGFVFRDIFGFLYAIIPWPDRAALLEQSIENHFKEMIGDAHSGGPDGLKCYGSLECPFMTLRPSRDNWLPLLMLNGTSVGTGHRIVTTVLEKKYDRAPKEKTDGSGKPVLCPLEPRKDTCELFANGFMFHELIGTGQGATFNDVRVSTAAHNSARFPFISPPGEILDQQNNIRDRIIDGGYFENFGAYTAGELAEAIRAIEPDLDPFVLVLSNDPQLPAKTPKKPAATGESAKEQSAAPEILKEQQDAKRPPSYESKGSFLADISGPIAGIMNARNAHGILAVDELTSLLDAYDVNLTVCNVAVIKVWAEPSREDSSKPRELSMSWWLSKPVQIYLHQQTQFTPGKPNVGYESNKDAIERVLAAFPLQPKPARDAILPSATPRQCPR